jgi:SNF2 family DNA or RNA helicase
MSGTPFLSSILKAWGTLNWLRPDVFSSFWRFAEEQFGTTNSGWNGAKVINKRLKSEEAFQDMLRPYYLARTKAEVAPQLPPIVYAGSPPPSDPDGPVGVYVDMEPEQAAAYAEMKEMASAHLEDGTVFATGVLAEIMRMKQFACSYGRMGRDGFHPAFPSGKFEWLVDFLDERKDVPGKVVVVSQFTKLVNLFAQELRSRHHEVVTLTGESTDRQRVHMQDQFLNGSPRVAIINVFAGGEAIDLSSADEIVFLDEPWTSDAITQAENRIQNLAKRTQLTVYRLRSAGTVDEWIANLTAEQRELLMSARPEAKELVKKAITG